MSVIELSRGPFTVTKETAPALSQSIWMRHYKPDEIKVARRFLASGKLLGTYFFDVYLLTARALRIMPSIPPGQLGSLVPFCMRVDATCDTGTDVYLIEFKVRGRPSGIGQLLQYRLLYNEQYKPAKPIRLMYVAEYLFEEERKFAEDNGIAVVEV